MARYRDRQTGRFVSKSTWTRSKAHDGTRYKREYAKPEPTKLPPPEPTEKQLEELEEIFEELAEEFEEDEEAEYEGAFDSP